MINTQEVRSDVAIDLCVHNPCEVSPVSHSLLRYTNAWCPTPVVLTVCLPVCFILFTIPLSVCLSAYFCSPVSWRNRLKIEGGVSCPKMEVTTASKTVRDFLQAHGHAEPPMHARASHLGVAGHRNWLLLLL